MGISRWFEWFRMGARTRWTTQCRQGRNRQEPSEFTLGLGHAASSPCERFEVGASGAATSAAHVIAQALDEILKDELPGQLTGLDLGLELHQARCILFVHVQLSNL